MTVVRGIVVLLLCLMIQQALATLTPRAHDWVDLMLVPVVAYSIRRSQRSAMFVGCVGGLLQDAWFYGVFGLNGFKKTLLGWALGGLGARFELNHAAGRFAGGVVLSLGDSVLDFALRRLLDKPFGDPRLLLIGARALITGLLVVVSFTIVERVARSERLRRLLLRRA